MALGQVATAKGSPAIDGGRGLKHHVQSADVVTLVGSPAIDGGRGLKPSMSSRQFIGESDRPPSMAGAD